MTSKDTALISVSKLVKRFDEQFSSYKNNSYNETLTRRDFIDPFFKALGWDVDNENGYAEAYREVIHEDRVKISGFMKAPDYSFRLTGGKRLFFVEAKKPSVYVKGDILPAYQVRRYGWSAKLPVSIITDFEEFSVYDCTKKPFPDDSASVARTNYITFNEYIKEFDFIWDTFSKEKVLKGSFDKFILGNKGKKGTATVDKEFLISLDKWRTVLAKAINKDNKNLNEDEINFAVQQFIDRIIFLRIAEDRNVEPYGSLKETITDTGDIYKNMFRLFQTADEKYNSGIFDFKKDKISESLNIDNKVIKTIVSELYYPESPYEFSVLSVEILGSAYEQFLGKQIRISDSHRVTIEDKPEVRKAGGVYYTPQYIVEYIVKNTVGKLIENKSPKDISKIKIVDPACGSGSFLLGAYQYLLDYHKDYYSQNGTLRQTQGHLRQTQGHLRQTQGHLRQTQGHLRQAHGSDKGSLSLPKGTQNTLRQAQSHLRQAQGSNGQSALTPEGNLTTAEKKRILTNNIFGVDIDTNAVEVTKLSLLLKCMEGETDASIATQTKLWNERVLPNIDNNIKSGNSLIDTDFYDGELDFDDEKKIKPFNWQKAFPEVFAQGGFDAVIGNPPYIRVQLLNDSKECLNYYFNNFKSAASGNYDIYVLFIEQALKLLNSKGSIGYILPHKFFNSKYGTELRKLITSGQHLKEVVHFGDNQIFHGATTYTCLLFLNNIKSRKFLYSEVADIESWMLNKSSKNGYIESKNLNENEWNLSTGKEQSLYQKLNLIKTKLVDISKIFVGLQTSADTVFLFKDSKKGLGKTVKVFSKELNEEIELEIGLLKEVIRSGQIGRYWINTTALLLFPYFLKNGIATLISESELKSTYPLTFKYLLKNKKLLEEREKSKFKNNWWQFGRSQNLEMWEDNKIMLPYMVKQLSAYYDNSGKYFVNVTTGGFGIRITCKDFNPLFITGLLNSELLNWFLKRVSTNFNSGYFAANKQFLVQLPICFEKEAQDEIIKLVDQLLTLNSEKQTVKLQSKIEQIQNRIDYCEDKINKIVYELYGLTDEEIGVVEGKD